MNREGLDCEAVRVETPERFLEELHGSDWDIVLSDYSLPRFNTGMEALDLLHTTGIEIPFLVVTGSLDEETAVRCLKKGADDYILKENLTRLAPAVRMALQLFAERRERNSLLDQLRQSQKMESVGQLASGVAHDFRNLLTVISNHLLLIEKRDADPERLERSIEAVRGAIDQAGDVARSLLDFSEKRRPSKRPLELGVTLRPIARLIERSSPPSVRLSVECDGREVWVLADRVQIQQVLLNLGLNAKDALGSEGGSIRIRIERVEKDGQPRARLSVEDDGSGIDPDVLPTIFQPFVTTKEVIGGTGMGLAVVKGVVEDHGGTIEVDSTPGAGSTFIVELPVHEPEGENDAEPVPRGAGQRILLAAPDSQSRAVLSTGLSMLGYEIAHEDPDRLLERLTESADGNFDLVMLEAQRGHPHERIRRLREKGIDVPVIVLSKVELEAEATDEPSGVRTIVMPFGLDEAGRAVHESL